MEREQKRAPRVLLKNAGGSLPQHLIMEILSWLPVKSLLKFRVVCKSWYPIIKNPYFISKHMQNYYSNNDDHRDCLIAQYLVTQGGELQAHELLIEDKTQRVLASERILTPIPNTYICGPCDGIYYMWCWSDNGRFLWNPALNEFKALPQIIRNPNLPSHIISEHIESYGFGYDHRTKDYKVIVTKGSMDTRKQYSFGYDHRLDHPLSVFIYSLKDDKWKYWGDMLKYYFLQQNKCYVFVNDCVYWLGSIKSFSYRDFDVIVAFNLATETYQELKVPSYEIPIVKCPALAVCYNSIALLHEEKNHFVMWCFNEGQWTKKCTINIDFDIYFQPLGHWKDDKIIFADNQKLIMYDVETQEKWYLSNPKNCYRSANIAAYKESLISIIDENEPRLKGLFAPTNWSMLHTSAAFISNAEPSGLAGCIRRKDGEWLLGFREIIYTTNDLMANILSILRGIIVCHNNGFNKVMVYSDCQTAVNLINQASPSHDMYYNVLIKCKKWKLKMQDVKIRFSGRSNNNLAKTMAQYCKENMKEFDIIRTIPFPPSYCKSHYVWDCYHINSL